MYCGRTDGRGQRTRKSDFFNISLSFNNSKISQWNLNLSLSCSLLGFCIVLPLFCTLQLSIEYTFGFCKQTTLFGTRSNSLRRLRSRSWWKITSEIQSLKYGMIFWKHFHGAKRLQQRTTNYESERSGKGQRSCLIINPLVHFQ